METLNQKIPAHKRQKISTSDEIINTFMQPSTTPSFLVMHCNETKLSNASPFLIAKGLKGLAGDVKTIKRLPSGDLLIQTSSPAQTECLLKSTKLASYDITVEPHNTLNSSRGVISESNLTSLSEEELLEGFASQGVTHVRRITIKRDDKIIPTKHVVLTFSRPNLPERIFAGYDSCIIRPFIPNPLRCFQCQKFGHSKTSCRGKLVCAKCGSQEHLTEICDVDPPVCINCQGAHPAYSRICPKWKMEKEVQTVKTTRNISYVEARKLVTPIGTKTYAAITKSTTTIATQTDISVPPSQSFSPILKTLSETPKLKTTGTSTASIRTLTVPTAKSTVSSAKSIVTTKVTKPTKSKPIKLANAAKMEMKTQKDLKGSKKASKNPLNKQNIEAANRYARLEVDMDKDDVEDIPEEPPPVEKPPPSPSRIKKSKPSNTS